MLGVRRWCREKETRDYRNGPEFVEVKWRNRVVGACVADRLLLSGGCVMGQTRQDGQIADLKLSVIWRGPVQEAWADALMVTSHVYRTHPAPSRVRQGECQPVPVVCNIRRSRLQTGHRAGGPSKSYAGHVRFGSARTSIPAFRCAGFPRQAHGLSSPATACSTSTSLRCRGASLVMTLPSRWGGTLDPGGRRAIRGRKFYWHADPDRQADWSQELQRE